MPALIPPDEPPLAPLPALQGWSPSALVAALAGALLALLALLVHQVGLGSALALLGGLSAIVGAAWLPERSVRWLAPLLLAGLLFAALRPKLGLLAAGAPAVLTLLAARRWASSAVLRRVTFIVPSRSSTIVHSPATSPRSGSPAGAWRVTTYVPGLRP